MRYHSATPRYIGAYRQQLFEYAAHWRTADRALPDGGIPAGIAARLLSLRRSEKVLRVCSARSVHLGDGIWCATRRKMHRDHRQGGRVARILEQHG